MKAAWGKRTIHWMMKNENEKAVGGTCLPANEEAPPPSQTSPALHRRVCTQDAYKGPFKFPNWSRVLSGGVSNSHLSLGRLWACTCLQNFLSFKQKLKVPCWLWPSDTSCGIPILFILNKMLWDQSASRCIFNCSTSLMHKPKRQNIYSLYIVHFIFKIKFHIKQMSEIYASRGQENSKNVSISLPKLPLLKIAIKVIIKTHENKTLPWPVILP